MEEHAFIFFYIVLSLAMYGLAIFSMLYIDSEVNRSLEKTILSLTLYFIKKMPENSSAILSLPKTNNFNYTIIITGEKIIIENRKARLEYSIALNVLSTYYLSAGRKYFFKKNNGLIVVYEVKN